MYDTPEAANLLQLISWMATASSLRRFRTWNTLSGVIVFVYLLASKDGA
jgi:hypothetical protein